MQCSKQVALFYIIMTHTLPPYISFQSVQIVGINSIKRKWSHIHDLRGPFSHCHGKCRRRIVG
uniref:Uncharacterized protein n=1 Tax=Rhizophora mucronata TaxID=61149 RepID=A0A2P2IH74_RHIMU